MPGLLDRLQSKKGGRRSKTGSGILVQREEKSGAPTTPPTVVVETPLPLETLEAVKLAEKPTVTKTTLASPERVAEAAKAKNSLPNDMPAKTPGWLNSAASPSRTLDHLVPRAYALVRERTQTAPLAHGDVTPLRAAVAETVRELTREMRLRPEDITAAVTELADFFWGAGPLGPLFDDGAVTDIWVDSFETIRCRRRGEAIQTPFRFRSREMFLAFAERLAAGGEKRYRTGASELIVHLDDGRHTRLSIVDPAFLDRDEPTLAFRIPRLQHVTFYELVRAKTVPVRAAAWLGEVMLREAAHIVVTGAGGTGKTTFAAALLSAIGSHQRAATIETAAEIFPPTTQLEKFIAPPNRLAEFVAVAERRAAQRLAFGDLGADDGAAFRSALRRGFRGMIGCWSAGGAGTAHEDLARWGVRPDEPTLFIEMALVDGTPCVRSISESSTDAAGHRQLTPLVTLVEPAIGPRRWETTLEDSPLQRRLAQAGIALRAPQRTESSGGVWLKS